MKLVLYNMRDLYRHSHDTNEQHQVFADHGWRDAAVQLEVPWQATAGHWPDRHGPRRLDRVLCNWPTVPYLAGYHVETSPSADQASDHRPVAVTFDPAHSR